MNGGCQEPGGRGNKELLFNEYEISFWEDKKVLEMDTCNGCTTLWI